MQQDEIQTNEEIISDSLAAITVLDPEITRRDDWDAVREETTRQAPRADAEGW